MFTEGQTVMNKLTKELGIIEQESAVNKYNCRNKLYYVRYNKRHAGWLEEKEIEAIKK